MGENTKIEWASHTFNAWIGCTRVSQGCVNCYAEDMMDKRYGRVKWGPGQPRSRTSAANWKKPLRWNKEAALSGTRPRVFCSSLADVFDPEVDQAWRDDLWPLMEQTPNLDWLILTKRPQHISHFVPYEWMEKWPSNVWLGVSVENQQAADERIPLLLQFPAPVRFLSCEPLVDSVDLEFEVDGVPVLDGIDWVIVGGESGPNARPMHPEWATSILQSCTAFDVPFLFKQWGEWAPVEKGQPGDTILFTEIDANPQYVSKVGKKKAGRTLDGATFDEFPISKKR